MDIKQTLARMAKGDTERFSTGARHFGIIVGYDGNNVYRLYQCGDALGKFSRHEAVEFIEKQTDYQTKRVARLGIS